MRFSSIALSLGLIAASWATPISSLDTPGSTVESRSLERRSLQGKRLRVLGLGDSITWGLASTDGNGWREDLLNTLKADGADVFMVGTVTSGNMFDGNSEGYPGATIEQISGHLSQTHTAFTGDSIPNVVLLHAGTNDCNIPVDPATANVRLAALIDQVRGYWPNAAIIVAEIIASPNPATQSNINIFNPKVKADVFARYNAGQHVGLVDMSNILTPNQYSDTLHPTDAGYAVMASYWVSAINIVNNWGWIV